MSILEEENRIIKLTNKVGGYDEEGCGECDFDNIG